LDRSTTRDGTSLTLDITRIAREVGSKRFSESLPECFILKFLFISLTKVKISHFHRQSVSIMSMQSHASDDNDDNNDATDDGDDDDTDGVLARDVVDGDGDDLDVAGDVVVDHHQEVVRVTVTEIPQYWEFTV